MAGLALAIAKLYKALYIPHLLPVKVDDEIVLLEPSLSGGFAIETLSLIQRLV